MLIRRIKNSVFLSLFKLLIIISLTIHLCSAAAGGENENGQESLVPQTKSVKKGRSMSAVLGNLDPLGAWKSASRIIQKGVHAFRESLQEGVKVAQMLKEDVDEGVTQIWGNQNKDTEKPTEDNNNSTPKSAVEGHSLSDNYQYFDDGQADQQILREGMIGGILRFMNVDSSRLGIIALNLLIFVAEMITSNLLGKDSNSIMPETRAIKANLMEWVVTGHNKMLDNLMKDATSSTLPEKLLKTLQDKTGNSTSCVQLLVCKMSPLIRGIQKTVDKQLHQPPSPGVQSRISDIPRSMSSVIDDIYESVPSKMDFVKFGDECETRFPSCRLLKFSKKSS